MNFGGWLLRIRKERGLTLSGLAECSGVDMTTISRIETGKAHVTFGTVIRLCEGIGVSRTELVSGLLGKTLPNRDSMMSMEESPVLTIQDVEMFLKKWRQNELASRIFVANVLNMIVTRKGEVPRLFVPEDVEKLLFHDSLYYFEVQYPPQMTAESITHIYRYGGVLTLNDVRIYIQWLCQEQYENAIQFATSVLTRLETGSLERMKLREIVLLDEQLEQNGNIVVMYWDVYKFHERISPHHRSFLPELIPFVWTQREVTVVSTFITMCRWLQHIHQNTDSWIHDLRLSIQQLNEVKS